MTLLPQMFPNEPTLAPSLRPVTAFPQVTDDEAMQSYSLYAAFARRRMRCWLLETFPDGLSSLAVEAIARASQCAERQIERGVTGHERRLLGESVRDILQAQTILREIAADDTKRTSA